MIKNYIVAVGGTGARCLEALVHLAAAGVLTTPTHLLLIDPDQNNGNSVHTRKLIESYHDIAALEQPSRPKARKVWWGTKALEQPQLFQAPMNRAADWNNPATATRKFRDLIHYGSQPPELRAFLDLFYSKSDLEMVLDVGYRGQTNMGAVALKFDLEVTSTLSGNAFNDFLSRLNIDVQNSDAKVFVIGSVFGGTGAAGLPTIPKTIANLPGTVIAEANRSRIRYGCAMMTPYFTFPKTDGKSGNGPTPDATKHEIATKAALLHYARVPPGYEHVYFIGAPERALTNPTNYAGGQDQRNDPHYAELVAALAALHFFDTPSETRTEGGLHFADSLSGDQDLGVSWATLPDGDAGPSHRETIKKRLGVFATLAYFYVHFLYPRLEADTSYEGARWYRHNFADLSLAQDRDSLKRLHNYCTHFLEWLSAIDETGGDHTSGLFHWASLGQGSTPQAAQYLDGLVNDGHPHDPNRSENGFDRLYSRLDELQLVPPTTASPAGLFLYLLHRATERFCAEAYDWAR